MLEMAETIISMVKSSSKIEYLPLPEDDPKVRRPVIDLAREALHWEPVMSLAEGIQLSIEYFAAKVKEEEEEEQKEKK